MGIDQLLAFIKSHIKQRSISDYRGKVAAVDTYGWLHRIIKSQGTVGKDIITNKNKYKYVEECVRRIRKLEKEGLEVIMVFDGGPLPRKQGEQLTRKKEDNEQKGIELLKEGNDDGVKKLIDSIDVTPEVAYQLIAQLKRKNIKFIVAPYEADAQLAYLSRQKIADVIITEDSDLLVFGANRILYKVDYYNLTCDEIVLDELKQGMDYSFFTHCMFMTMCIMTGCDYLPKIDSVGIKTSHKCISRNHTMKKALAEMQSKGKDIPKNYQYDFVLAFLTFRFQRVYCPKKQQCREINDLSLLDMSVEQLVNKKQKWSQEVLDEFILSYTRDKTFNWDFLGRKLSNDIAVKIAKGQIDPTTLQPYKGNAFEQINYKQILPLLNKREYKVQKKYSPKSQQVGSTMRQFLETGKISKRMFEYKKIISQPNNFTVMRLQDDQEKSETIFSINPIKPIKTRLQIRQDDQVEFEKTNYQQIQSNSQNITSQPKNIYPKIQKNTRTPTLKRIAEQMFNAIFSPQYLKSPFSYFQSQSK